MSYLLFASAIDAAARSAVGWQALDAPAGATRFLWAWHVHPTDGRAALIIPPTPQGAQIDMPQGDYDALLDEGERARLTYPLPDDWAMPEL
ncbi:hypothetical protein [Ancylobacter sp. IITR112]|uniref:hypothetical protein n=1 Tax=Ancylobacter sp. IITR112 TaxID=3138073 RepID=UPI00352B4A67